MRPLRAPFVLVALASACAPAEKSTRDSTVAALPGLPAGESFLSVEGGRIWYKVSGGGAGFEERPVVRYDQLGGGKSDATGDTSLFNVRRFVGELDSLRAALGYARFHLVGHSWGTMLGVEYYQAHPDRVASLTLMSAALDAGTWQRNAQRLVRTLSDSAQRAIAKAEAGGKYDSPAYEAANSEFMSRYVMLRPVQADLDSTFATVGMPLYTYMWGLSEYTVLGTLKSFDATGALKGVKVPTLFTVGEVDEADVPTIRKHASMTPGARVEVIPDAAHITMWDNPEQTLRVVRDFLRQVDEAGSCLTERH